MRVGIFTAILAASCTAASAVVAACPSTATKTCVDFAMTPNFSDRVIPVDRPPLPTNIGPAVDNKPSYTGPTVGVSPTVRKTPTVGYRWAIN